jgi:hypothetical protein
MSIVMKKIGKREYAYLAYRSGKRVVHKYIGPASDPGVATRMAGIEEEKNIPGRFQPLFWDVDPRTIDVKQHARYIIERVLEMGGLDALYWIQRLFPTKLIMETCEVSRKISPKSRNFWEIWFGLRHAH